MGLIAAICGIASAALSVAKSLGAVGLAIEGVKMVVNSLVNVCKSLGLIKEETKPEELGDKAIQAEEQGIKPENFKTYKEYVKAVENFEIDPEKSKLTTEKEKAVKASELSAGLLMEKMPNVNIAGIPLLAEKLPPEKIAAIISTLKDGIGSTYNSIIGVVTNKEKDTSKISNGLSALALIEKSLNPALSDQEALKKAMNSLNDKK